MDHTDLTTAPARARPDTEVRAQEMAELARGMARSDRRPTADFPPNWSIALRDSGLLRARGAGGGRRSGAAPRHRVALRRGGGARRRFGRLVCVDRDHQQPAGGLSAAGEPRRVVRCGARRGRRGVGAAGQGPARAGGVVVSGRWAFCSGITHADVLFAGCVLDDRPAGGRPAHRAAPNPRHLAHARSARHGQQRRGRRRRFRPRHACALDIRWAGDRPSAVPIPAVRLLRRLYHRGRNGQRPGRD